MIERNRELQLARRAADSAQADVTIANARPNPDAERRQCAHRLGIQFRSSTPLVSRVDTERRREPALRARQQSELRREAAQYYAAAAVRIDQVDVARRSASRSHRRLLRSGFSRRSGRRIAADTAGMFDRTVDAAERRVQAGDLSRADLASITVDALRARERAPIDSAEAAEGALRPRLHPSAWSATPPLLHASDPWPSPQAPSASNLDRIVDRRADVQAAQARLRRAERNRHLAQSLRTRDVTAGVQYDRRPTTSCATAWAFAVSVPLFLVITTKARSGAPRSNTTCAGRGSSACTPP